MKPIDFKYIKFLRDQNVKGETPSSDFVKSVTHSITNICYCVQYVLYLTYSNEICSMFFIYPTCYLKQFLTKNHDYYFN